MSEGAPKPNEGSILSKVVIPEGAVKIIAKGQALVEEAKLNEAIRIMDRLEDEVTNMVIPARFNPEKIPPAGQSGERTYEFQNKTEPEFKRAQLLKDLRLIKGEILNSIQKIQSIVGDIEATKQES